MDLERFDAWTRDLTLGWTRRGLGAGALVGALARTLGLDPDAAAKKRKKKKTVCYQGQTRKVKKKRKKLLKKGATKGACPACIGNC
jgi:hypothetical protein